MNSEKQKREKKKPHHATNRVDVAQNTMDLYDDLDAKQRPTIDGWSSGIKLLQTQLALKKATVPPTVRKELPKRSAVSVHYAHNDNV